MQAAVAPMPSLSSSDPLAGAEKDLWKGNGRWGEEEAAAAAAGVGSRETPPPFGSAGW
jgi:hypothetical protein